MILNVADLVGFREATPAEVAKAAREGGLAAPLDLPPLPWFPDGNGVAADRSLRVWTDDGEQPSTVLWMKLTPPDDALLQTLVDWLCATVEVCGVLDGHPPGSPVAAHPRGRPWRTGWLHPPLGLSWTDWEPRSKGAATHPFTHGVRMGPPLGDRTRFLDVCGLSESPHRLEAIVRHLHRCATRAFSALP